MWSSESCILLKYSKQLERRPEALERARNLCQLLCEGFAALLLYLKHSPIFSYFSNLLPLLTSFLSAANLLHNVRQYMTAGTPAVPEGRNDRQGVQIYCLLGADRPSLSYSDI